jgi:hypothetical protein
VITAPARNIADHIEALGSVPNTSVSYRKGHVINRREFSRAFSVAVAGISLAATAPQHQIRHLREGNRIRDHTRRFPHYGTSTPTRSASALPKPALPTVPPSSCCTAGPMTFTAIPITPALSSTITVGG